MKKMSKQAFIDKAEKYIIEKLVESGYNIDESIDDDMDIEITDDEDYPANSGMWEKYIQQMQAISNGGSVKDKISICSEFEDENGKKFYITVPQTDPIYKELNVCPAKTKGSVEFIKTQEIMMDYAIKKGKNPAKFVRSFTRGANKTVHASDATIRIGGWDGATVKKIDMTKFDDFFINFSSLIYSHPDKKAMITIKKDVTIIDSKDFKYTGILRQTFSYSPLARMIYLKTWLTDLTDEDYDMLDNIDFGRVQVSLEREIKVPKDIEYDNKAKEANYSIGLKDIDMWFRTYTDMNSMFRECQTMKEYRIKDITDDSTEPLTNMIDNVLVFIKSVKNYL